MLDHLPLARHQLQRLGHVLAQLVQRRRRSTGRPTAPDRPRARAADAPAAAGAPACAARRPARPRRVGGSPICAAASACAVLLQLGSCSSSWSSSARRSDDWPNRSCRSLAIVCLQLLDQQRACASPRPRARCQSAPPLRQRSSPSALAMSSGSGSSAGSSPQSQSQHRGACPQRRSHADSQCRISPPPADARSVAASASRCLPADSRAAPA